MMHIAFAIDSRFVRPCAVTMVSVLRNNVPYEIVFHIVGLNLHQEDVAFLSALCDSYGAKVFFYEVAEEKMKGYEVTWEKQRLSKVVFFRCLLSSILPLSVSKVLYLDCDVLVLSSLYGLWETDLTGVALAGVPDSFTVNPVHCRRLHYASSYNYFNGGVLLLNLEYWRAHGVERLCAEHYRMYPDRIVYNDQDLLNSLLHERKRLLDMKWNVQEGAYRRPKGKSAGWVPPHIETITRPAILHYSGRKPWQYHCMHPLRRLYFEYESLLPGVEKKNDGWAVRLHRFVHFLPYALGIKSEKYIDIRYYGSSKKTLEGQSVPLISIVVPVYNVERYVEKCIRSLRGQTYGHIEVILVDDASTDGSYDVCKAAIGGDPRFKLIRHPVNQGVAGARNLGLSVATGELLGFVDPDDWIEQDMYALLYDAYVVSGADIVQCGYYLHLQNGNIQKCAVGKNERWGTREALELLFQDRLIKNYLWNKLYKRKLFDGVSFPVGRTFEDILTLPEVFGRAKTVYVAGDITYHYVERHKSIVTKAFRQNQWDDYLYALDVKHSRAKALGLWKDSDRFLANMYLRILDRFLSEDGSGKKRKVLMEYLRKNVSGVPLLTKSPYLAFRRFLCLHLFDLYKGATLFFAKFKKK